MRDEYSLRGDASVSVRFDCGLYARRTVALHVTDLVTARWPFFFDELFIPSAKWWSLSCIWKLLAL